MFKDSVYIKAAGLTGDIVYGKGVVLDLYLGVRAIIFCAIIYCFAHRSLNKCIGKCILLLEDIFCCWKIYSVVGNIFCWKIYSTRGYILDGTDTCVGISKSHSFVEIQYLLLEDIFWCWKSYYVVGRYILLLEDIFRSADNKVQRQASNNMEAQGVMQPISSL
jgi:hypothetical protein